jgi:3-hydroxybutyryl-CoA dehydrogenase
MEVLKIRKVSVIGSGLMGHGIAQTFALGGLDVAMNDVSEELLQEAIQKIRLNLDTFVEFGITTPEAAREGLSRIKINTSLKESIKGAGFVVEAVPEISELKKKIFREIEQHCPPHAIIASNTSGLSLTEMAAGISHPERAVIAHWWNPPHIIPVVEIVKGRYTSDQTVDLTYQLLKAIGKKPVRVLKEVPGLLGNRLQYALYREALACLLEGVASAEDIDLTVKGTFGFRLPTLGPIETMDFGGLDTLRNISKYLFKEIDRSTEPPKILIDLVEQGKLGVKTGEGFYRYPAGKIEEKIRERDREFLQRLKCLYLKDTEKKG